MKKSVAIGVAALVITGAALALEGGSEPEPLYVFYAVHAHQSSEIQPYLDDQLQQIDPDTARNFEDAIQGIAAQADASGVKITWEFVSGVAKAAAEFGDVNLLVDLESRGHEIAMHTHKPARVKRTVRVIEEALGHPIRTGSGLKIATIGAGKDRTQGLVREGIEGFRGLGLGNATIGLVGGPQEKSPIPEVCQRRFGHDARSWDELGLIPHPYRPAYREGDLCRHDPEGDLVFIDHVSQDWMRQEGGRRPADLLDASHFEKLRAELDRTLLYMETERPERLASWGFVTHLSEFALGNRGAPPREASLEALGDFLSHLKTLEQEGKVRFATISEIADRVE